MIINHNCGKDKDSGLSLIEISILIIVIGLIGTAALSVMQIKSERQRLDTTSKTILDIKNALSDYIKINGRLPCPASMTAPIDSADFGQPVAASCSGTSYTGTQRDAGAGVLIGAVPIRALNLPDTQMVDGWKHRIVYAVTESFATIGADMTSTEGAIRIVDLQGNSASSSMGNVIYALSSPGEDRKGAYDLKGQLRESCGTGTPAAQNCLRRRWRSWPMFQNMNGSSETGLPVRAFA